MSDNHTTLTFSSARSRELELIGVHNRGDNGAALLVFACVLVTIVFIAPFDEFWTRSVTYAAYFKSDYVDPGTREGRLDKQLAIGFLGLFGLAVLTWRGGKSLRARSALLTLGIAYLAWCALTCLWSDDFGMSVRRLTALFCEVIAGLAIARRCSARQFVWLVLACTSAWLLLGVGSELAVGSFQPGQEGYRFAGISHPNTTAANCALLLMAALYLSTGDQRAGRWLYVVAIGAGVFLLLTGSRTALGAMIASVAVTWFLSFSSIRKVVSAIVLVLAGVTGWAAMSFGLFGDLSDAVTLGRVDSDAASLSGRTPLWHELLNVYLPPQQLVGHGYGAFWNEHRILEISDSQGWSIPHAHSSYIDLVLNTGYIGAVLCLSTMALAFSSALGRDSRYPRAGFGFIAMIVMYTLTGSLIETYIGITWFMSFFVICGICYLLYQDKPHLRLGGNG